MSFPVALNQKLNQCHHKDRKAFLHHLGLPSLRGSRRQNTSIPTLLASYASQPPKTEVVDAFTWLLNPVRSENASALLTWTMLSHDRCIDSSDNLEPR